LPHIAWLLLALSAEPAPPADTVVVCPPGFQQAIVPWIALRERQGHGVALVSNSGGPEAIRDRIRRVARSGKPRYVVLVGDVSPANEAPAGLSVPAHYAEAKVNIRWGSEPRIATDNWYADLDDDDVPEVAIGRLSADTPAQLTAIIDKIVAYERAIVEGASEPSLGESPHGLWRRQINLVAGLGGFGALADAALEAAAKAILVDGVPAAYVTTMTQASWHSPYCPPPVRFDEAAVRRLNEGCLFWVYLGHGHPWALDQVHVPGGDHEIFTVGHVSRLRAAGGPPIALFLACYTAAYDTPRDCLAEELLRSPGGPVAAIGGSRVTMPYAMSVLGIALLKESFQHRRQTLGEVLLHAKRSTMLDSRSDATSQRLDAMAALFNPTGSDLAAERREHLHLFNLLGDPLLTIAHPLPIELTVAAKARSGSSLEIEGQCPIEGEALIELAVRRDRLSFRPPSRGDYRTSLEADAEFATTYQRANDTRLATVRAAVVNGRFSARLEVPEKASGACHVRVFVPGRGQFAAGAADVEIARH
jgi:hypothetical protein